MTGDTISCDECDNFMAKAWKLCAKCGASLDVSDDVILTMASKIKFPFAPIHGFAHSGKIEYYLSVPIMRDKDDEWVNVQRKMIPSPACALIRHKLSNIAIPFEQYLNNRIVETQIVDSHIELLNRRQSSSMLFSLTIILDETDGMPPMAQTLWFSHEEVAIFIPIFSGKSWINYMIGDMPSSTESRRKYTNLYLMKCIATFYESYILCAQQRLLKEDAI